MRWNPFDGLTRLQRLALVVALAAVSFWVITRPSEDVPSYDVRPDSGTTAAIMAADSARAHRDTLTMQKSARHE